MKLKERILIISLLLLASAGARAEVNTGVYLNKTATYDYATQTGTIKLENFVGQVTKKINLDKSADVVLIVDGSSSMNRSAYGMDALYSAVGEFVDELRTASIASSSIEHRVSLIIFAGCSKLLCDFTSLDNTSATPSYFQGLVETACGKDGTHIDYYGNGTMMHIALGLASYVMTGDDDIYTAAAAMSGYSGSRDAYWTEAWDVNSTWTPTGARTGSDYNRYVVLMTDGALTGRPRDKDNNNVSNHTNITESNNETAEDQAVYVAKQLKNSSNYATSVYCIGFLSSSEATQEINNNLNNISSNHLSPTNARTPNDDLPHDYYIRVDRTGGDLSAIFGDVSEEIVAGCAAVDLASAEVKDIINGGSFKLPAGVTNSNLSSAVKVYTVPCTSYAQTSSGPVYTFDESSKTTVTVTLGLSKDADDNPIITASGFDYTANWCGYEYDTSYPNDSKPHGCKLVIEIPFTVTSYTAGLGEVETNVEGSGFTGTINGGGTLNQEYGSPVVDLYELTISRKGLKAGESAIYRVTDKDGKLIYTIALTGTGGSGAVKQKVLYVPDGNVTVTETGWGWANRPSTAAITNTISASNSKPTYSFSGSPSGTKNPEDYKKNEFNN